MKFLVTGAPGWMGTQLVSQLVKLNITVKCLVQPKTDISTLNDLGVETVVGDVVDKTSLKDVCKGVDVVIHCAGIIHPKKTRMFHEINTQGTMNLANEAIKHSSKRFVYVSSSSAGSGYSKYEATKETDPPAPYKQYGHSKRLAEQKLMALQKKNLEVVVLRPHFIYGPGGPLRQLKLIKMIKRGRPVMFGNGSSKHSLCHIHNCIEALILAAQSKAAAGNIYYIADSTPYTTTEIYEAISLAVQTKINPTRIPLPSFESVGYKIADQVFQGLRFYRSELHLAWDWSKSIYSDISKAKKELRYNPQKELYLGMVEAVEGYKKQGSLT